MVWRRNFRGHIWLKAASVMQTANMPPKVNYNYIIVMQILGSRLFVSVLVYEGVFCVCVCLIILLVWSFVPSNDHN